MAGVDCPDLVLVCVQRIEQGIELNTWNAKHSLYAVCEQPFDNRFCTVELRHSSLLTKTVSHRGRTQVSIAGSRVRIDPPLPYARVRIRKG